jgi:hypothetical protein
MSRTRLEELKKVTNQLSLNLLNLEKSLETKMQNEVRSVQTKYEEEMKEFRAKAHEMEIQLNLTIIGCRLQETQVKTLQKEMETLKVENQELKTAIATGVNERNNSQLRLLEQANMNIEEKQKDINRQIAQLWIAVDICSKQKIQKLVENMDTKEEATIQSYEHPVRKPKSSLEKPKSTLESDRQRMRTRL